MFVGACIFMKKNFLEIYGRVFSRNKTLLIIILSESLMYGKAFIIIVFL